MREIIQTDLSEVAKRGEREGGKEKGGKQSSLYGMSYRARECIQNETPGLSEHTTLLF